MTQRRKALNRRAPSSLTNAVTSLTSRIFLLFIFTFRAFSRQTRPVHQATKQGPRGAIPRPYIVTEPSTIANWSASLIRHFVDLLERGMETAVKPPKADDARNLLIACR